MKVRMSAESKRHRGGSGVADRCVEPQSVAYLVVNFELEGPWPDFRNRGIIGRIEHRSHEMRPMPQHFKGSLTGKAVHRMAVTFVDWQLIFGAAIGELRTRDAPRPWKQNWNPAAMRMRTPCARIARTGNHLERADAIAEALASRFGDQHCTFALRFDRDRVHA